MKLKALTEGNSFDFFGCDNPICPHCGDTYDIRENEAWQLYSEQGPHEVECPACEEIFKVSSSASWTFSTDEQEDE